MNYTVPNPPMDVLVKRINDTHIGVSWSPLSLVEARGWITNYTVYYSPTSSKQYNSTTVSHNLTSVVIGGLMPEVTYVVQVSASTAAGEGEKSEELEVSVKDMQSSGE